MTVKSLIINTEQLFDSLVIPLSTMKHDGGLMVYSKSSQNEHKPVKNEKAPMYYVSMLKYVKVLKVAVVCCFFIGFLYPDTISKAEGTVR